VGASSRHLCFILIDGEGVGGVIIDFLEVLTPPHSPFGWSLAGQKVNQESCGNAASECVGANRNQLTSVGLPDSVAKKYRMPC
jgi:hypothetical protein